MRWERDGWMRWWDEREMVVRDGKMRWKRDGL